MTTRSLVRAAAILAACGALCTASTAWAQAEACTDAGLHPISEGVQVSGNFTGSTNDGPTGCGGTGNLTQWWSFTPVTSGVYTISMCGSAHADTVLGVTLGSAACTGSLTYLACNDDSCGLASQVTLSLTGGTTYRIRAATFSTVTNGGGYTLLARLQSATAPAGDVCPTPITASVGSNPATILGATANPAATNPNTCGGSTDSNDVFFSFTPTVTGWHRFSVCTGDFDAVTSIHTACPVNNTTTNQITGACDTSAGAPVAGCGNRGTTRLVNLTTLAPVIIRVAGATDAASAITAGPGFGAFDLVISQPGPVPANDLCANAVDLNTAGLPYTIPSVDATGATSDVDVGTCNTGSVTGFGVWYTYTTGSVGGRLVLDETNTATDVVWGVFTGACPTPTVVSGGCLATDSTSILLAPLTTYRILLGNQPDATTTPPGGPYTGTINFVTPPANDDCVNAINVTSLLPYSASVDARAANSDTDPGTCNSGSLGNSSVWYSFTAPSTGVLNVSEGPLGEDCVIGIFTGTCGTLTSVNCTDNGLTDSVSFNTTGGTTYFIQVSKWSTSVPLSNYNIQISFAGPPANDTACAAEVVATTLPYSTTASAASLAGNDVDNGCNATGNTQTRFGVWYSYTPLVSGGLIVRETSSNDTSIAIFTGPDCNTLTEVYCYDDTETVGGGIPVVAGNTYWILVGMFSTTSTPAGGGYALTFESVAPPANGDICTATTIVSGGSDSVDARADGATDPANSCDLGTGAAPSRHGVWYTYTTGVDPGNMNINETSSNDVVVALFTGATCGTATEVGAACQTNDNANFALAANTQYWFLVALTSADDCPTASPNPNYAFSFTFTATTGACCISGVCSLQTASGCATNGGTFIGGSCTGPLNGTEYNSGNTFPIAIPDNSPTGASTTVVISGSGDTVGSEGIAVKLGLTHTWVGDLVITISNGAITRTIMSRVGDSVGGGLGDSSNLSGNYLFLDTGGDFWAAAAAVDGSTNVPTGNYRATGALNAVVNLADFNGQPLDGTWTAFATDNASGDLGSFTAFSIRKATTTPVCPTAPPCPEDIDDSGFVDADDIFAFLNIWFAGPPGGTCTGCTADWDGDGTITADDIFAYLNDWFAFGPGNPCP